MVLILYSEFVIKQLGNEREVENLLENTLSEFPDNPYLDWVFSVFKQDGRQEEVKSNIPGKQIKTTTNNTAFTDREFKLVADIIPAIIVIIN